MFQMTEQPRGKEKSKIFRNVDLRMLEKEETDESTAQVTLGDICESTTFLHR